MHLRDLVHHPVPVAHELRSYSHGHERHSDAVGQRVEHRPPVLAVLAEFGPVLRHWLVVIDQAPFHLDVQGRCRHGLYVGKHLEERVSVNLLAGGLIGQAAPLVDHQFAC